MNRYLDFESEVEKIENKINELDIKEVNYSNEKDKLLIKKNNILTKIYSSLSPWEKVQVARHPERPHSIDYINMIFKNTVFPRRVGIVIL